MVLNSIEKLIEKYDNGETTLKEEQHLRDYFSQDEVAPHLEVYKPMFMYFLQTQQEQYTKDVPLKPKKTNNLYRWISVAAITILMLGLYWSVGNQSKTVDTLSPEELIAYNQTMEAFNLLSSNFNKGKENMSALGILNQSLEKGSENVAFLGEFNNSTNKIFKTNKNN